jgi:BlaI family transcriptional regulator, penicillinase repressor
MLVQQQSLAAFAARRARPSGPGDPAVSPHLHSDLGRRERQIVEVVYRLGRASVTDVLENLPDPPSYSAVRAMLRILETKGHLKHEQDGPRYVYLPAVRREKASRSALHHLVRTFFEGSTGDAVAALLEDADASLSEEEIERLSKLIRKARRQGR